MNRHERIDLILDHYENPRHLGRLERADVVETGVNPGCGDVVTVYLRVDGADRPVSLSFKGEGCTISQAAASMTMELMQGWTLAQIEAASSGVLFDLLGPDMVASRPRCVTLAFDAVKRACREYKT